MSTEDTLDDLKKRDIDNLSDLVKEKSEHLIGTSLQSLHTQTMLKMRELLSKFSVDIHEAAMSGDATRVDEMLKRERIRIEFRKYQEDEDVWRSGLYVYRDGEIIGFFQLLGDRAVAIHTPQGPVYTARFFTRVRMEPR